MGSARTLSLPGPGAALVLLLVSVTPAPSADPAVAAPAPAAVADVLRHQERLVRAVECEMDLSVSPTRPDMIAKIREVCQRNNTPGAVDGYIYTAEDVAARRATIRWYRLGAKERIETFNPSTDPDGKTPAVKVFDGSVVRTLERNQDGSVATINTTGGAHWNNANRPHPLSFLYTYQETPYSELIRKGVQYKSSYAEDGGRKLRVAFQHPAINVRSFDLVFDDQFRLLRRDVYHKDKPADPPYLRERHTFSDYKRYDDPSGEKIWFPSRVDYDYYMGVAPDGTPACYSTEHFAIRSMRLNSDIPEDKFSLTIPADAKVYDGVNGMGWMNKPSPDEERKRMKRLNWRLALLAALFALVIGVSVFIRVRRKPAPGSESAL
jgi:hypothetical protein